MRIDLNMDQLAAKAQAHLPAMLRDIERVITRETPSSDHAAVAAGAADFAALLTERLGEFGAAPELIEIDGVKHVRMRFGTEQPQVVLVNHQDTVWPHGTLDRLPFSTDNGKLRGPGSFDMLTGAVQSIYAALLLAQAAQAEGADPAAALAGLSILVTGDEEVGSVTSSALIRQEAAQARAAFVMEASHHGALKIERKGTSMYTVVVHGKAAHAGLEPEKGINAGLELAYQLQQVADFGDAEAGTTVTPTLLSGGTTTNTVPAQAQFDVDVRARTVAEQERVDALMNGLSPQLEGARIEVRGGINRPPLERATAQGLFDRAVELGAALGLEPIKGVAVGGGSDGNFTAGDGIPTLDGLGAVGDGAHAEHEHALIDYIPQRTALLAALISDQLG